MQMVGAPFFYAPGDDFGPTIEVVVVIDVNEMIFPVHQALCHFKVDLFSLFLFHN